MKSDGNIDIAKAQAITPGLKSKQSELGTSEFENSETGPKQRPPNRQKEGLGVEIEYRGSQRKIIEPLPNGRLVPYTMPLIKLQTRPSQRYKSICARMSTSDVDSGQFLVTRGMN